jgi:hypothetical protein
VARVFRSDAIVSLQFRRPTAQWIFTASVRGDNKTPDDFAADGALPGAAAWTQIYIFARQPIRPRSRAPIFSIQYFSASRRFAPQPVKVGVFSAWMRVTKF